MTYTIGMLLLICVAIVTGLGQIFFKKVATRNEPLHRKLTQPLFLAGGVLFAIGPVLSALAASVIDYTVLYGMTSLNYLVVLVLARVVMGEPLDCYKVGGVATIVLGLVVMVSG